MHNNSNHPLKPGSEEYESLVFQVKDHIGIKRFNALVKINNSFNSMVNHYRELYQFLTLLDEYKEAALEIKEDVQKASNLVLLLDEKILLATASMTSFLDIIQSVDSLNDLEYFNEIKNKNNEIMNEENNAFLKRLRQYLNHYGVIPWRFNWLEEKNPTMQIDVDKLLLFKQWNLTQKEIIKQINFDKITLAKIIELYLNSMVSLWIPSLEQLHRLNQIDLEKSNKLKSDIFSRLTGGNFSNAEEWRDTIKQNIRNYRKNEQEKSKNSSINANKVK